MIELDERRHRSDSGERAGRRGFFECRRWAASTDPGEGGGGGGATQLVTGVVASALASQEHMNLHTDTVSLSSRSQGKGKRGRKGEMRGGKEREQ